MLPASVRGLWRLGAVLILLVLVVPLALIALVTGEAIFFGLALGVTIVVGGTGLLIADLSYKHWSWGMDDEVIEAKWGVMTRNSQIVPRRRVQTVTTETGPYDRYLGLVTVVVHTAGTHSPNLSIPHLEAADAERIQARFGR
jgi:membrane protein YdbS with pleckstrin-like domain